MPSKKSIRVFVVIVLAMTCSAGITWWLTRPANPAGWRTADADSADTGPGVAMLHVTAMDDSAGTPVVNPGAQREAVERHAAWVLAAASQLLLEALQELTRLAVQQASGNRSRLMLDIAGWRQARRDELTEQGLRTAKEVLAGGESVRMRPMTPFERKVVHDAVARVKGVSSESEGEEPRRQVVIFRGD